MTQTFTVYAMRCGACGFTVSAMTDDRKKVAMLDHLIAVHTGDSQ